MGGSVHKLTLLPWLTLSVAIEGEKILLPEVIQGFHYPRGQQNPHSHLMGWPHRP